ncbi:helix-turn-helix transcriptional regulator [Fulvivirga kasyanovii]|uniref:XRE family transcriptional regulator n=1 Tax=Fulvivirga kasyanovii TaxID=396812 RepID=A0ABW9RKS6_9BACT|nr:helix-turn-helix transcriptional regulator [Fulvivirga kasyanovii]MTI24682.1 XRE family transcriptional regulator [Fulvivirga kasyanovii]
MTKLGEYLNKRSINKSAVSRKTGINKNRLSELSNNPSTQLKADELYLIALAIEANPCELLEFVCGHLGLEGEE